MQPTRINDFTPAEVVLAVALELSNKSWKIALQDGRHDKPSIHTADDAEAAKRLAHTGAVIAAQKVKWQLPPDCRVVVMYEAGQDGFWIARALEQQGYEALITDPASIPVERQARRAKTDRLDAIKLVNCLLAYLRGERDRMHAIRIPEEAAENQRQLVRERGLLQKEIGQHRDRMRKLLRTQGSWVEVGRDFAARLQAGQVRRHDGTALPPELQERLCRECERLALVEKQFAALESALVASLPAAVQERIGHLQHLQGVGGVSASRLVLELFWRHFDNRREVGACTGLVPQPYNSGDSRVDQGISKQGNRRVRALAIEMSWLWLRHQPESALSRWFAQRTRGTGANKRGKRIAIVAVARRLMIALWRYLEDGVMPEGAQLKGA